MSYKIILILLMALALAGCSSAVNEATPQPETTITGHYASSTEVICSPCATYSLNLDLWDAGSCEYRQAVEAFPGPGEWSTFVSSDSLAVGCMWQRDGSLIYMSASGTVKTTSDIEGHHEHLYLVFEVEPDALILEIRGEPITLDRVHH